MNKLFGAMLIIFCGLLLGCTPLLKLVQRKQMLGEMMHSLSKMKSELCTASPSLPQLMYRMRDHGQMFTYLSSEMEEKGPMAFYDAWHYCVERELCLTGEEKNTLHSLGDALGRYVLEEQVAAIEGTIPVLREGYVQTKEQMREVGRLYIGMGLSLSVMLVIVLV